MEKPKGGKGRKEVKRMQESTTRRARWHGNFWGWGGIILEAITDVNLPLEALGKSRVALWASVFLL